MPTLNYIGYIQQRPFNNERIGRGGDVYSCDGMDNYLFPRDLNFLNNQITWNTPVPNPLQSRTLNDLINNPLVKLSYSINVKVSGGQTANVQSRPTVDMYFTDGNNGTYFKRYQASPGSGYPIFPEMRYYEVNDSFTEAPFVDGPCSGRICPITYPTRLSLTAYNREGTPGFLCYAALQFSVELTLTISVSIECSGDALNSSLCGQNYCLIPGNYDTCFDDMSQYCLNPNNPEIINSETCQTYFSNILTSRGPRREVDDLLNQYCQRKFNGFRDLFEKGTAIEQDICACHMQPEQYQTLVDQIQRDYTGLPAALLGNPKCLLPQCNRSSFKSIDIGGPQCASPACLNISSFTNEGNFSDSIVNIIQQGECVNVKPRETPTPTPTPSPTPSPSPNPNPTPSPSPSPTNTFQNILIIVGIILFTVILVTIIVIVVSRLRQSTILEGNYYALNNGMVSTF